MPTTNEKHPIAEADEDEAAMHQTLQRSEFAGVRESLAEVRKYRPMVMSAAATYSTSGACADTTGPYGVVR